jgi:cyclic pyranopterin phosphate synthase
VTLSDRFSDAMPPSENGADDGDVRDVRDRFGRPLRSLRVSVTDRCNFRCTYCMPETNYVWLPREDILDFEEIDRLVAVFVDVLGVDRVRITGGEPLLRVDLDRLVAMLARQGIGDLSLTTNGVLLPRFVDDLRAAGLQRVTVSLDSLRRERFARLSQRDALDETLAGIDAARAAGLPVKINTVVIRGENDDELLDLLAFARERQAEVRFIEYMDVGGATRWQDGQVLGRDEMLARIAAKRGRAIGISKPGDSAPAARFALPDGQVFGIVSSTTAPFCSSCDRARLTADGHLFTCLYARHGIDLRGALRAGADDAELAALLASTWSRRDDRGAERRLAERERRALHGVDALRAEPHLEMHTRGG